LIQKTSDVELLVINDGSTDSTDEEVGRLQEIYPGEIEYIKTENVGLSATRNRGIDESSGAYIVFLDADDALLGNGLNVLREGIARAPHAKMVAAGHISVSESGSEVYHRGSTVPEGSCQRLRSYLLDKTISLSNGAVAMHRDTFDKYRYKEEFKSSEDLPMFAFVLANYPVVVESKAVVKIHKHRDSMRHNVDTAKAVGELLINEIFDLGRMPVSVMGLKKAFTAQRYLSISRTCFFGGDYSGCESYYRKALLVDWRVLFKLSYARKALKAWRYTRRK